MRRLCQMLALAGTVLVSASALADEMVPVGAHFINQTLSNTFTTLIDPATNAHGIHLRTCTIYGVAAVNGQASTALATVLSPTNNVILVVNSMNGAYGQVSLPYPLFLPAGVGLYGIGSGVAGNAYCTYDVISIS